MSDRFNNLPPDGPGDGDDEPPNSSGDGEAGLPDKPGDNEEGTPSDHDDIVESLPEYSDDVYGGHSEDIEEESKEIIEQTAAQLGELHDEIREDGLESHIESNKDAESQRATPDSLEERKGISLEHSRIAIILAAEGNIEDACKSASFSEFTYDRASSYIEIAIIAFKKGLDTRIVIDLAKESLAHMPLDAVIDNRSWPDQDVIMTKLCIALSLLSKFDDLARILDSIRNNGERQRASDSAIGILLTEGRFEDAMTLAKMLDEGDSEDYFDKKVRAFVDGKDLYDKQAAVELQNLERNLNSPNWDLLGL